MDSFAWLAASSSANAQKDVPLVGLLYNTSEATSLTYQCRETDPNTIDCEFQQVTVRRKAKIEDLPAVLEKAAAEFANMKPNGDCGEVQKILDAYD